MLVIGPRIYLYTFNEFDRVEINSKPRAFARESPTKTIRVGRRHKSHFFFMFKCPSFHESFRKALVT